MDVPSHPRDRLVSAWLLCVCLLIVAMVGVGGVTRLTGSGLSIVEWRPIMGALPPLSDAAWQDAFAKYQATPQFRLQNAGMSLAGFKGIFFWEYVHRLLGRGIGVAFLLPWLWFERRRRITPAMRARLAVALFFGALQGFAGWFMVRSGLVDRPSVSHFRLALHLSLALGLLAWLSWTRLGERGPSSLFRLRGPLLGLTTLAGLQIIYGALTAGLHAGHVCSTFPDWNGALAPAPIAESALALVASPVAVHFVHRVLGTLLFTGTLALWLVAKKTRIDSGPLGAVLMWLVVQYALGVATVMLHVPVAVAVMHQLGACVLLLLLVRANHAAWARAPLQSRGQAFMSVGSA